MTTIKMHYQPVKDGAEKALRTVEDIMLREQELAEDAEKFERERKAEEDAAVMALGNPAAVLDKTIERGAPVNATDSMELCSTAETVELFGEYYDADFEQKEKSFLISDTHASIDLDFNLITQLLLRTPETQALAQSTSLIARGRATATLPNVILLFEGVPSSAAPLVSCAYRLGKLAQKKPRAILVELTTVSAKHRAFKASSRLGASRIRLDEDLTTQQMQQRKGLSSDFLGLKVRGFKPFFRGTTLKYMDGGVVRQCAKGGLTKSGRQLLQFLALAQPTGLSIPMWQWILLSPTAGWCVN
ncbi:TPA: hypothetical protein ACH3X1_001357 [Trebouxia sp. C0004]